MRSVTQKIRLKMNDAKIPRSFTCGTCNKRFRNKQKPLICNFCELKETHKILDDAFFCAIRQELSKRCRRVDIYNGSPETDIIWRHRISALLEGIRSIGAFYQIDDLTMNRIEEEFKKFLQSVPFPYTPEDFMASF